MSLAYLMDSVAVVGQRSGHRGVQALRDIDRGGGAERHCHLDFDRLSVMGHLSRHSTIRSLGRVVDLREILNRHRSDNEMFETTPASIFENHVKPPPNIG